MTRQRLHLPAFLLLALAVLLTAAWRFDGPSRGYWDTYITAPAMHMAGQPVDLRRMDGSPRFSFTLKHRIPDDTFDPTPGSFGIASKDQRIGTAILFAAPFSLLRMAAFRWGYALSWALLFGLAFVALQRLLRWRWVALAAALLLVFNPFSLYLDRLNGNLFGLVVMVFLWLLLTEERPAWWFIGLLYGICGGIRNEAIIFAPLFLVFMGRGAGGVWGFTRRLAAFTAAAFLAILPVLRWNHFAYGAAIVHPSQVAHLDGFRPTFPHSLLGARFQFNGLLNWPFHDHLVRTPHFAFPTFIHWPLVTVGAWGLLLAVLAGVGALVLLRRRPLEGAALLFWYGIVALLFAFQENWEELKQTFMALHLFPLVAFTGQGVVWLAEGWRRPGRWLGVVAGGLALALVLVGLRRLEFPVDERWYVRFPHAATNDAGLDALPPELRKSWQFFYTHETQAEIARERAHMTRISLFPLLYRPIQAPRPGLLARLVDETRRRDLTTLAVWSYIYE